MTSACGVFSRSFSTTLYPCFVRVRNVCAHEGISYVSLVIKSRATMRMASPRIGVFEIANGHIKPLAQIDCDIVLTKFLPSRSYGN